MSRHETRVVRLARFFERHPNQWIDGRTLAPIAGTYAWRTRISDLRRAPYRCTIENRQRSVMTDTGTITVSEYRYVPEERKASANPPYSVSLPKQSVLSMLRRSIGGAMPDMGRWRRVYSAEWHIGPFQSLSDVERMVYFYCRTGPQSTSVGIYRISTAVASGH